MIFLLLPALGSAAVQNSGVVYAQPGQTVVLNLQIDNPQEVLINKDAPTRLTLTTPFKTLILEGEAIKGPDADYEPQTYFARLDPLKFKLDVPRNLKKGSYPLLLNADVFMCNTRDGLCYMKTLQVKGELRIGEKGENQPMVVKLPKR
ncbi:hypothetical protein [Deinococcus roseus]|uniref:Lipoprotein n=1 Tax=Deinococcus roseus TaxID=392414 RepID=A0ABQ2CV37_9DEIO|nr:hypothetical protein [Deinococcus roseus]GGJ23198.1 hypothetical protein GCM10008938_06730 [Deinococcus roseus]